MEFENPFVFDRPLEDGRGLVGRERELAELVEAMESGAEGLVEGPHRHGKTSLVNAALAAWDAGERALGVRVDCSGVLTVEDLAHRLNDAFVRARAEGRIEDVLVEQLETLTFRPSGRAVGPRTEGWAAAELDGLLSVAGKVAELTDTRAVVCFDEFQDALAVKGVVEALQRVRGCAEGRVAYVFVGTELASRREGAGAAAAWREGAASVAVGVVDPELFAEDIARRFAGTGREGGEAGRIVAGVGAGHPQRTSLLAWHLWELTGPDDRATVAAARMAIENALHACAPELDAGWTGLHSNERRVTVAIAKEIAPQGTRAQRATGLAGFGSAQRALQGVKTSGVVQARDDRLTLTDPLFAEWLRRRYAGVPPEPNWTALRQQHARGRRPPGLSRGM